MNKKAMIWMMAFFSMLFLINSVSASGSDWGYWRSPVLSNGAGINSLGLGGINSTTANINMTNGINVENIGVWNEPLLFSMREPDVFNNYLFIPNGNFVQIYDQNLNIVSEVDAGGKTLGQLSKGFTTLSTSNPLIQQAIYGVFRINSTLISLRGYSFNFTSYSFNKFVEANYTSSVPVNSSGMRCQGSPSGENHCYSFLSAYNSTSTNYTIYFTDLTPTGSLTVSRIGESASESISVPTFADWDNDGVIEALGYTLYDAFTINTVSHGVEKYYNSGLVDATHKETIRYGAFARLDSSPYWKLVLQEDSGGFVVNKDQHCKVIALKNDLSTFWSRNLYQQTWGSDTSGFGNCGNFILSDYNSDNFEDIWAIHKGTYSIGDNVESFTIVRGTDGTILRSQNFSTTTSPATVFPQMSITGGRLSNSTGTLYDVFVQLGGNTGVSGTQFIAYSVQSNLTLYSTTQTSGTGNYGCIIGDFIYDGYNDIVCSRNGYTFVLGQSEGTFPNSAPTISNLTFSPSTTVQTNTPMTVSISASDLNGDSILYKVDCGNGVVTAEDGSYLKSCTYSTIGIYTLTAYVRDGFHVLYNQFSVPITVIYSSLTCNVNYVCESGETFANCPSDCATPTSNQTNTIVGSGGGISIPTQLVNVNNEEEGLLPNIYLGILAFISNALLPIIVFASVVFLVLTIFAVGGIIKKIANKVGK